MGDILISLPGGKRVDAHLGGQVIRTDQPSSAGGEDSAPAPFDLFLASLGTCAGFYVLAFCQARGISTEGIRIVQRTRSDEARHLQEIDLTIVLPESFPAKYREAVIHAADECKVKRTLAHPPAISVQVETTPATGTVLPIKQRPEAARAPAGAAGRR
jgi:ribosomal protein S12 methylthiotransferase accessory factor